MRELPDPPGQEMTEQDREHLRTTIQTFAELLPAVQHVNEWTDDFVTRVDARTTDRYTREQLMDVMWKAEFIERVLKHTVPHVAVMDMVSYIKESMGSDSIQIKEISAEEAKTLGYL